MIKTCLIGILSLLISSSSDYPTIAGKYKGVETIDVYLGEQEQEREFVVKQNGYKITVQFAEITIILAGIIDKDGSFHVSGYERKYVWDSILKLEYETEMTMEIKGKYENRKINAYTFSRYVVHHPYLKTNPAIFTGKLKGKKN